MKKISNYQLFTELQRGPITWVYKALQPELERVVLVKQLNPDLVNDQELVERFKQEGLTLAKIKSPHVITIFDFGHAEGIPFLVTEFIEGNTLADLIERHGALPWDICFFILQQLAQGLAVIHNQNIIHQDIKPENIFVTDQGEAKLGDLGFSISLAQANKPIQGTPAYLPPELILGSTIDFRSDLYSLGVVGYEMLTGENPFAADDMQKVLHRIVNLKPISIHGVKPEVPEQLSNIISKLMSRDPNVRCKSAQAFYQELEELKISTGIKVDSNSFIRFSQEPEHYQPIRLIPSEPIARPIQRPKKQRRTVFAFGLIAIGILIFLLSRFMNDGFSFLPNAADTSRTQIERNFNQPENTNTIPENREEKTASKINDVAENTIEKEHQTDTLQIPIATETRGDTIVITSDPRAVVFRNGDSLGFTPLIFFLKTKNELWEMEFRTPGFPTIKKTVTIFDLPAQKIHINLWQEVGFLDLSIMPWGEIWIDGDSVDVSPISHPIILTAGNHKITVRHPSLKNATELFYIAVGETLRKDIYLQRRQ